MTLHVHAALRLLSLALVAAPCTADGGPWTLSSLSSYVRARAGGHEGGSRIWQGSGVLTNTITGVRIADVGMVERCERSSGECAPGTAGYASERILVYRDENGTVLARYGKRRVPVLHYKHDVLMELSNGDIALRATDADGRTIAGGWGDGPGPRRTRLLGRTYELFVRPRKGGSATDDHAKPPPPSAPGMARTASSKALTATREEYRLKEPLCLGGECSLEYRRTGRCPSWYGAGLCTLEVHSRVVAPRRWARPWLAFGRKRGTHDGDEEEWIRRATALRGQS